MVAFALGVQEGTWRQVSGSDSTEEGGTHSRERARHQLQKELPQKETCIDKGRGPQRQEEGAFERFQILGVWD